MYVHRIYTSDWLYLNRLWFVWELEFGIKILFSWWFYLFFDVEIFLVFFSQKFFLVSFERCISCWRGSSHGCVWCDFDFLGLDVRLHEKKIWLGFLRLGVCWRLWYFGGWFLQSTHNLWRSSGDGSVTRLSRFVVSIELVWVFLWIRALPLIAQNLDLYFPRNW